MSTEILTSNDVVKTVAGDFVTHPAHHPVCMALRERIEQTLRRLGVSQRELSRRSGLTEVHVGQIVRRLEKDPEASIELPTLQAIARGAGVSLAWLLTGQGSPDADDTARGPSTTDDVTPVMANAIGFDDAYQRARQDHPEIPEHGWRAMVEGGPYVLRGIATKEEIVRLAREFAVTADPARMAKAFEAQAAEIARLKAELVAQAEEKVAAPVVKVKPTKGRGEGSVGKKV